MFVIKCLKKKCVTEKILFFTQTIDCEGLWIGDYEVTIIRNLRHEYTKVFMVFIHQGDF
jgi:hypothetical protein